ncbi:hypothetical protein [Citricoccus nitrophenolicus]|uniref:hypothetical protein n=1 Tax=Citricoccus nitrophenolicus TaxID=863575 RepID=UPI0031EA87E6
MSIDTTTENTEAITLSELVDRMNADMGRTAGHGTAAACPAIHLLRETAEYRALFSQFSEELEGLKDGGVPQDFAFDTKFNQTRAMLYSAALKAAEADMTREQFVELELPGMMLLELSTLDALLTEYRGGIVGDVPVSLSNGGFVPFYRNGGREYFPELIRSMEINFNNARAEVLADRGDNRGVDVRNAAKKAARKAAKKSRKR